MGNNLSFIDANIEAELMKHEPGGAVLNAVDRLYKEKPSLLFLNAGERSICFRLGMYLQESIGQWTVDVEYDRTATTERRLYMG